MADYHIHVVKVGSTGEYKVRPGITVVQVGNTVEWFNDTDHAVTIVFPNGDRVFTRDPSQTINANRHSSIFTVRSGPLAGNHAYRVNLSGNKVHGEPCRSDPEIDV